MRVFDPSYTDNLLESKRLRERTRTGQKDFLIKDYRVTIFYGVSWRLKVLPLMEMKPLKAKALDDFVKENREELLEKIK